MVTRCHGLPHRHGSTVTMRVRTAGIAAARNRIEVGRGAVIARARGWKGCAMCSVRRATTRPSNSRQSRRTRARASRGLAERPLSVPRSRTRPMPTSSAASTPSAAPGRHWISSPRTAASPS